MRQAAVFGVELLPFAGLRIEVPQLFAHPNEAFRPFRPLLGVRDGLFPKGLRLAPSRMRSAHAGKKFVVPRVGVQKRQLPRRLQERLMRVLAVNVDQHAAHILQLRRRHGNAVHPTAGAARRIDRAAQEHFVTISGERMIFEPKPERFRHAEGCGEVRLGGAFAYDVRVGPGAQDEAESVDQDRLPGTGFTGQHREAGRELHVERLDDHEVPKREREQHREPPHSPPETCRRTLVGMKFHLSLRRSRSK